MLALLGYTLLVAFMFLIMTKRMTAQVALILLPVLFALAAGFGLQLETMMLDGVKSLAPTGIMLLFAILYFAIMIDTGLFNPLISKILRLVKSDPLKITVGTALLALIVSLDGDGTTTYLITISAMYPLYKRLKMNLLILAGIVMLGTGVTNIIPWGGPTARVMSALNLSASELFVPLIPALLGGAAWVVFVAYLLGKRERKRLGIAEIDLDYPATVSKRFWFNLTLTLLLMISLITQIMPLPILFMIGFALALMVNYPDAEEQKAFLSTHAANALTVVSLVFAAGIFTGILSGTKMIDAMAQDLIAIIPQAWGKQLPTITALTSMPFTFFMSNDAYYFGILPLLTKAAASYGITPSAMGRAALLGQPVHLLSPLVASTYLLVGMAKVEFGEHQRFTLIWAVGTSLVMLCIALISGVI